MKNKTIAKVGLATILLSTVVLGSCKKKGCTDASATNYNTEAKKDAAPAVDGKALFAKCAGCHGADGKTKALGKSNIIAGLDAKTIEEDLKGYKAGTLNQHGMGGLMKGQVASYSDADIKAVAEYIHGLK